MKYLFIFLLIPFLNYSQSKDVLKVYPYGQNKDIELVDGFIFKIIIENKETNKNETGYFILVKETYSSNYYVAILEWSNKLNSYKGNTQRKIKPYGVEVNYIRPNKFKIKSEGIEYTSTFSKDEMKLIDEFGKEIGNPTKGQLKSKNDVEFMISSYAFNMGSDFFDKD